MRKYWNDYGRLSQSIKKYLWAYYVFMSLLCIWVYYVYYEPGILGTQRQKWNAFFSLLLSPWTWLPCLLYAWTGMDSCLFFQIMIQRSHLASLGGFFSPWDLLTGPQSLAWCPVSSLWGKTLEAGEMRLTLRMELKNKEAIDWGVLAWYHWSLEKRDMNVAWCS